MYKEIEALTLYIYHITYHIYITYYAALRNVEGRNKNIQLHNLCNDHLIVYHLKRFMFALKGVHLHTLARSNHSSLSATVFVFSFSLFSDTIWSIVLWLRSPLRTSYVSLWKPLKRITRTLLSSSSFVILLVPTFIIDKYLVSAEKRIRVKESLKKWNWSLIRTFMYNFHMDM